MENQTGIPHDLKWWISEAHPPKKINPIYKILCAGTLPDFFRSGGCGG